MKKPLLTLVGAGPGDEDLITLKGIKALRTADVVLYDALANTRLLDHAPAEALKIFVGKRAGQHLFQQREINRMIVQYAHAYGHVVRLKGGDPFIFGRGQEEKEYALKHGLAVDVVPGISSALAVPALQHIPLTHRGASESFWILTGSTRNGSLPEDMPLAASSSATVVILMGMKSLAQIVTLFLEKRGGQEPIALIQHGTCQHEKVVVGRLENILTQAQKASIGSPAVIVIGSVVEKHLDFVKQKVSYWQDQKNRNA